MLAIDPRSQGRTSHRAEVKTFDVIVELPFGRVGVRTRGESVEQISFLADDVQCHSASTSLAQLAVDHLLAYCADSSRPINLPLLINGTEFQRQVWSEIAAIPCGQTRSYGDIARRLAGSAGDARAVGQACGDNRLPLAIPCHRVVAATGIGGFAHRRGGAYERIKRWLLMHETDRELRLT